MKKKTKLPEGSLSFAERILEQEIQKQKSTISLIASENLTSQNVRNALCSVFTNKYAEGYPGNRYYSGCEFADAIESYAINLVKEIFGAKWANVQPHSGSQANQAVFFALLNKTEGKKDTILSLSLEAGGHLTHGAKVSSSGQFYNAIHYGLNAEGVIDMNQVAELANQNKPKIIIAGGSAYPRNWDWKAFRQIADSVNAYLLVDMAHIAGIVAVEECENPVKYAHIVTSTTHKTLRGPRGGIILSQYGPDSDECGGKFKDLGAKIDRALFPGIQGGPLMNIIAAKAISFEEVKTHDFKLYMQNVLKNAKILANALINKGGKLVSNGTDNHLLILDCRSFGMNAKEVEILMEQCNVYLSKSALVGDSWKDPNGVRLGTPYITNLLDDITDFADYLTRTLLTKDPLPLRYMIDELLKNSVLIDSIN